MRIHVVQSGGIAGLRSEQSLDTEQLPPELQQRISQLVEGAAFFARAPEPAAKLPDMIQYRVRIDDGERAHEVTFDDGCGEAPLLELVEAVSACVRARR